MFDPTQSNPNAYIEEAKRHEQIAMKYRELAKLFQGVALGANEKSLRASKLSGLAEQLKQGSMKVKEVQSKFGVSRPSVYAWIAKNKDKVVNSDGVISIKP